MPTLDTVGTVLANVNLSVSDDDAAPAAADDDVDVDDDDVDDVIAAVIADGRDFNSHDVVFAGIKIHIGIISASVSIPVGGMADQGGELRASPIIEVSCRHDTNPPEARLNSSARNVTTCTVNRGR